MSQNPEYAVQRASSDDYTSAQLKASAKANLLGEDASTDAEEDLEAIIVSELPDALAFSESEMGQKRAKATEYYLGALFGNEEEGRSKVVSRDVLSVVSALLPSIMRTFFGGRRRMKFAPVKPSDVKGAEQATEWMNKIVMVQDNNGFLETYAAAKDALIRYMGIFKWWWDDSREVTTDTYTGQSADNVLLLANDPEMRDIRVYREDVALDAPETFSVIATRDVKHVGKARFGCVSPEEVLINRDAISLQTARFLDHRRVMTLGELVALGYDKDDLLPHISSSASPYSAERQARSPLGISTLSNGMTPNELQQPITYHEVYTRADMDGDGFPELIKACGCGDGVKFEMLHWEPVSEIPFCSLDPDPEPHTLIGSCPGGNVMPVQLIKSALLRMSLDGAALSLEPRLEVVEHMVELEDLLDPALGGVVRTKAPGQIAPIRFDFNPVATQGLLDYMDQVREELSKQSRPSQGLDADALQSSAKLAVAATLSGAQQSQEMICRLFAEGIKQLMLGLLRLTIRNADQTRMMKFRGEWVEVDPRTWNTEMGVEIEVGVGVGGIEMELQGLLERKANQEAIIQLYGPSNPIVSVAMYRDTLAKIDELRGLSDTDAAYKPVPEDWQPPAPAPVKSDAQLLQETAMAEIQMKDKIEREKLELEKVKVLLEDERERLKLKNDFEAKMAAVDATAKTQGFSAAHEAHARTHEIDKAHEAQVIDSLITGMTDQHAAEVAAKAAPTEAPANG